MAKRKMTPLAQALVLVDGLSAEEQATLGDYLRGKLLAHPNSTTIVRAGGMKKVNVNAPTAAKRSSRKGAAASSTPSTEAEKENALAASGD